MILKQEPTANPEEFKERYMIMVNGAIGHFPEHEVLIALEEYRAECFALALKEMKNES